MLLQNIHKYGYENLLSLKEKDFQKIIKEQGFSVSLKGNPAMRKAIWKSSPNLDIQICEIEFSKSKEDGKEIL